MESEDSQEECMEIIEAGRETTNLPEKSSKRYKIVYNDFINWIKLKQKQSFSEKVLLSYFDELSEKYKSSSLWSRYSMLRSTLMINHNVNIESYSKLRAFLKQKSENYTAKKANTLSADQIQQFIKEAPDNIHLATKVALIMGVMGACRKTELYAMKEKDVQELGTALLVIIPNNKTKVLRNFTIINEYYDICKKYINLRPRDCNISAFFLNYQKGKCTTQRIGINKFSNMGKQIAEFLNLPNANLYTGHTFRRSSATLMVDSGGDINPLKLHRRWKTNIAESYINTLNNKIETENFFQKKPRIDTDEHLITNFKEEPITNEHNLNIDMESTHLSTNTTDEQLITIIKEEPIISEHNLNDDNSNTTDEYIITNFKEEPNTSEDNLNVDMENEHLGLGSTINSNTTGKHLITNFEENQKIKPNININMKNTHLSRVPKIRVVNCPNSNIKDEHLIANFEGDPSRIENLNAEMKNKHLGSAPMIRVVRNSNITDEHLITNLEEEPITGRQNINIDMKNEHLGPVPTISVVNCPNSNITINYYIIPNHP